VTDLSLTIRRWREDAAVLKRNGEPDKAAVLTRCADEAEATAADYLEFITEEEAMLVSGRSRVYMRAQFKAWQPHGHARQVGHGKRLYRRCVVPVRGSLTAAIDAGRRAAMGRVA